MVALKRDTIRKYSKDSRLEREVDTASYFHRKGCRHKNPHRHCDFTCNGMKGLQIGGMIAEFEKKSSPPVFIGSGI